MSNLQKHAAIEPAIPAIPLMPRDSNWYAIYSVARHEKQVARQLQEKGVFSFLPLLQQVHRWSDRRCKIDVPLFSCYAFVRIVPTAENRVQVLRTPGVLGFVGSEKQGTPIPEEQIENLRAAVRSGVSVDGHPYLKAGQKIRIRGGSLNGVEGILMRNCSGQKLVLSLELLKQSVSVKIDGYGFDLV